MQSNLDNSQMTRVIDTIHGILKPFLLRRLKVDVENSLPPKKEYVLYAPLSISQREAYDEVLNGSLRQYLLHGASSSGRKTPADEVKPEVVEDGPMKLRSKGGTKNDPDLFQLGEAHRQKIARTYFTHPPHSSLLTYLQVRK